MIISSAYCKECVRLEYLSGLDRSIIFPIVERTSMQCKVSATIMNKIGESGLSCFGPLLLGVYFPGEPFILIAKAEFITIFDSQDMNLEPRPLFASNSNRNFQETLSKAFSKSIFRRIPGVFEFVT